MIRPWLLISVVAFLRLNLSSGQNHRRNESSGGGKSNGGGNSMQWGQKVLQDLIPKTYSKYESPANFSSDHQLTDPARVMCDILPIFVTRLSMRNMEFTVDLKIRIEWLDHRLKTPGTDVIGRSSIPIAKEDFANLWKPGLRFLNCKGSEADVIPNDSDDGALSTKTSFTKGNRLVIALRVAYRKELTFRCDLHFEAYPFDVQRCEITLQLIYNSVKEIQLNLSKVKKSWKYITVPPGFHLALYALLHCGDKKNSYKGSAYYTVRYKYAFSFQRIFSQHIMLIYIPSVLIVVLSWISFWLDVKNAAPRIALGLTTLLTLSTQFNTAQKDLPAVAEIKAIDVWMFACMFMVFASLIEYAVVVYCDSKQPVPVVLTRRTIPFPNEFKLQKQAASAWAESQRNDRRSARSCCIVPAGRIDAIACFFFPVAFTLFNFGYWSYFLVDVDNRFRASNGNSTC